MAWIKTVRDDESEGLLTQLYDAAIRRAGRVYNIVRSMSPNPPVLEASMGLFARRCSTVALSRGLRELLAVIVSKTNGAITDCRPTQRPPC
jgi:hypothetical protein